MNIVSCGLIVVSPSGWLLAHATNSGRWDLPKGRPESGETTLQTALRETWEETNLDFGPLSERIQDLGSFPYIPKKDLHLFYLELEEAWSLDDCACHTMVTWNGGRQFPETDRWEWVPQTEVLSRVGKGLGRLIRDHQLLDLPSTQAPQPLRRLTPQLG